MAGFASAGPADLTLEFQEDEEAQADPLRRFFPSKFRLASREEGLVLEGINGRKRRLGRVFPGCGRAEMGLPSLGRPWRIEEEREAVREGVQAFLRACLQCRLLEEGGTLLHAAGITHAGRGYAFVGHTRAGKTTLARKFPARDVVGDDLVAVRGTGGAPQLFGTPWPGREGGAVSYGGVSLVAIFNLNPGQPPGLCPLPAAEGVAELVSNAPRLGHAGEESRLLAVFSSLAAAVPIYRMSLDPGDDVTPLLRRFFREEGGDGGGDREGI